MNETTPDIDCCLVARTFVLGLYGRSKSQLPLEYTAYLPFGCVPQKHPSNYSPTGSHLTILQLVPLSALVVQSIIGTLIFLHNSQETPPSEAPSSEPPSEAPSETPPSEAPSSEPPSEAPSEQPPSEAPSSAPPAEAPSETPPAEAPSSEPPSEAPSEPPPPPPSQPSSVVQSQSEQSAAPAIVII